jgi:hypothetical protein
VKLIEVIDEALSVTNGNAVLSEENKFRMRNLEFLAVRRANCKGAKTAAAKSLLEFLHVHILNLSQAEASVKASGWVIGQ